MSKRGDGVERAVRAGGKPAFLITIDTEGDNLWAHPRTITTRNAEYLPRFQTLCESYGLRPTYLANHEMAVSPAFQAFGRDVLRRGTAEIGMHLHAWNSPPIVPLTADDYTYLPYLIEYPEVVLRDKVARLTGLLEDTFGVKMRSHCAGRWSFNELYARVLVEHGYQVDCSVTPHVSWRSTLGDPSQAGGTDYTRFQEEPYFVDLADISRPGSSPLLEVPLSIDQPAHPLPVTLVRRAARGVPLAARVVEHFYPEKRWLVPARRNARLMRQLVDQAIVDRKAHVELAVHSSELMPGGSPPFPNQRWIEALYANLEELFDHVRGRLSAATLTEFRDRYAGAAAKPGLGPASHASPMA